MKIELSGLAKSYDGTKALDRVSLEINAGRIVAVLGANGAGKTTLLRCLAGLAAPDSGYILFDEEHFSRDRIDLRRRIGFLPDFPFVFWEMSVLAHVGMCLRIYEKDRTAVEERVVDLLTDFDLLPLSDQPLQALSRGQLYKAALVALMAVDPEVWLLDEPFASGMDPDGINALKKWSRSGAQQGRTILYTTQILDVVEKFSDQVCILHQGEVRASGPLSSLLPQTGGSGLETIFQQLREEKR
jgi:ABC-type multidrug transport system ATPase subunit